MSMEHTQNDEQNATGDAIPMPSAVAKEETLTPELAPELNPELTNTPGNDTGTENFPAENSPIAKLPESEPMVAAKPDPVKTPVDSQSGSSPKANTKPEKKPQKPARPKKPAPSTLTEPGMAERAFQSLSWLGLPVLLALTALMCVAELSFVRTLWFSDEVRHADVYMRLLGGDWLALSLNGMPYPDKPPLYFWFLQCLDSMPGLGTWVAPPMLFFLGTALSAVLFVGASWLLARATGHDKRESFAAGLLVLGCLFFAGLAHYPRMDLLFAAVIVLSLLCLYRGWCKDKAPLWLTAGFVLAGVAALIKGPLALAFPILSSILFLIIRGTPGRLNGRDGILGFALMLLMIMGWATALYFTGHADYLREIFGPQIAGRIVNAWHHAAPWWYYLAALPLVCLPWVFLIFFVNWWAVGKNLPDAWKKRRENGGRMWLWIIFLSGLALLSAVSGKIAIYLLPVLPALAIVAARAMLRLTPARSRWFFFCVGVFWALLGLTLALAQAIPYLLPYLPENWATLPAIALAYMENTSGLVFMGLVAIVFGVALLRFSRRSLPGGALLLTSMGTLCLMQPYALVVAPSLDTMLSPRAQAEVMAAQMQEGFSPAAYRVYPGIYSYYVNEALAQAPAAAGQASDSSAKYATVVDLEDDAALSAFLREHPRVVIAMREKDWLKWGAFGAKVVHRQWIVDQPYILMTLDQSVSYPMPTPIAPMPPITPITPIVPPETPNAMPDTPTDGQNGVTESPMTSDAQQDTVAGKVPAESEALPEAPAAIDPDVSAAPPAAMAPEAPAAAPASSEEPTFL